MRALAIGLVVACGACAGAKSVDVGLEGLDIDSVDPGVVVPGTQLTIQGNSFVPDAQGAAVLHLVGTAGGSTVDVEWSARFVDYEHMVVEVSPGFHQEIGGDVDFEGDATIEVVSAQDGERYTSPARTVSLQFRRTLTPSVASILSGSIIFVNDAIEFEGDGFLLGGTEGSTLAAINGCFDAGGGCISITPVEIAASPRMPFSRQVASFPFKPQIAGIRPGAFSGNVTITNRHAAGDVTMAEAVSVTYDVVESQVIRATPTAASLGQYVFVEGGGFVGGEAGASTELQLLGTYTPTGQTQGAPVDLTLIPEFVSGNLVRYVLNEDDTLGQTVDLRTATGTFSGTIQPVVTFAGDTVVGDATPATFSIAPVKQVVYLNFMTTYVETLRDFGLRAVDHKIRERIIAVMQRAYEGVNIDIRTELPTDFAHFTQVDLTGVDPQNSGLFGYDNTPGKDDGNIRLYDRIGGVNAATQQDGYPGFGGVFLRSLFGFSLHPPSGIEKIPGADPMFDDIFDPFRADRGDAITSVDLSGGVDALTSGGSCPATDRKAQIACAIFVMGNLVGGTTAHELGHSLGLANPYAEGFHNAGDAPNRLMDAGGDRPFLERSELMGLGPSVFCDEEYSYLRMILPVATPEPAVDRPSCF